MEDVDVGTAAAAAAADDVVRDAVVFDLSDELDEAFGCEDTGDDVRPGDEHDEGNDGECCSPEEGDEESMAAPAMALQLLLLLDLRFSRVVGTSSCSTSVGILGNEGK